MLRGSLHIHCAMYVQVSMSCTLYMYIHEILVLVGKEKKYRYYASLNFCMYSFLKGGGGGGWGETTSFRF